MADNDAAILALALERFRLAQDAESAQRTRELDDLRFEFDPWTEEAKKQRGQSSAGGVEIPARPMKSIPSTDQPIQLIENQQKAAHLGVQIHPEGEDASDATAEVLQDLYRDIETKSRANIARDWGFQRAIRCGRGFYEIKKVYADEVTSGPGIHDQKLVISRILNQASVSLDCFAEQPNYSDMEWAFISSFYSVEKLKREYPNAKADYATSEEFTAIGDSAPLWYKCETGSKVSSVRVTVYYCVHYSTESIDAGGLIRDKPTRRVIRYVMTGLEIVESLEWDGQYIPIVPVIGRETNIDGTRRWDGVIGKAKEPARVLNWGVTTAVESLAMSKSAPWVMAEGQEEGHENEFVASQTRNLPYVRYKPTSLLGQPVAPPVRNLQSVDLSGPMMMIEQGKDWVHMSTFAFAPTLGQPDSHRSGKAVLALQQQADQGTSNYLDNLAQMSMTYEAMVILDLIPHIYDRPGRIVQIRGKDDKVSKVILNQPFIKGPNGVPQPVQGGLPPQMPQAPGPQGPQQPQAPAEVITYDLNKGRYSVTVSVGKSYQTRIQQGADQLGQLLQAEPSLMPILGWRWAKFQEWPGHEEASEDLKKLRPPQLQEDPNGDAQAKQQLGQAMQMVEALTATVKQQTQLIETKQVEQEGKMALARLQESATLQKAEMDNETKVKIAELQAKIDLMALRLGDVGREDGQRHEVAMAAADATQQARIGAMDHVAGMESSDRQHQQALEAGDVGHQQSLEAAEQAAALAPQQEPGA